MLLRSVLSDEMHHSGVRMVLVMMRTKSDMGQDAKVTGTSSQHGPEQVIIARNQRVSITKLTGEMRGVINQLS